MREFELIELIRTGNHALGPHVVVPPGDDLGMLELPGGGSILAGVDQVVGGIHLPLDASPERHARKLMNRSLSDVAAMAAVPVGMIVSAALPEGVGKEWGGRFSVALGDAGAPFGCPVFGGDIAVLPAGSPGPVLAATVLAVPDSVSDGRVVLRSGALPGDELWVSGCFGGSLEEDGGGHHELFTPRVELARALHADLGSRLTAMIDVSDGLAADIGHIARESGVHVMVEVDRVPRRTGSDAVAALCDGEDYELCFTVRPEVGDELPGALEGVPLTRIGRVEAGDGVELRTREGVMELRQPGWEHGT